MILGNNPSEWKADILHAWRYQIIPDMSVLLDLVQPNPPRADIEDHIAHVILTQNPSVESSVLLTMEFQGEEPPNVLIRFATVYQNRAHNQMLLMQCLYLLHSFTIASCGTDLPSSTQIKSLLPIGE